MQQTPLCILFYSTSILGNVSKYSIHSTSTNIVVYKYTTLWVLPSLCDIRQLLLHEVGVDVSYFTSEVTSSGCLECTYYHIAPVLAS